MAPELYSAILKDRDFRTSSASDSYSFGLTILELMTLQPPFVQCGNDDAAAQQARRRVRPHRPENLRDLMPNVLDSLWELLEAMWAHASGSRPSLDVVLVVFGLLSSLQLNGASSDGSVESNLAAILLSMRDHEDWVVLDGANDEGDANDTDDTDDTE